MTSTVKKILFWGITLFLLPVGIAVSLFDLLDIKNTSVFLLGLYWTWAGVSAILRINPDFGQKYAPKLRFVLSVSAIGMGLSWMVLSLFKHANSAAPVLLITLPFLVIDLVVGSST